MNTKVFLNTIRLGRMGLLWYAIGIAVVIATGALGESAMQGQGEALKKIIEGLPPAVLAMFKINLSSFTNPVGYMSARALSLLWPLVVIAFAAGSAGGISNLIERGTIHFELSLPVSRSSWFFSRMLAGLLGFGVADAGDVCDAIAFGGSRLVAFCGVWSGIWHPLVGHRLRGRGFRSRSWLGDGHGVWFFWLAVFALNPFEHDFRRGLAG